MRRLAPVLLAVCFLGLGSGLLRFAHDAAHANDDAAHCHGLPDGPTGAGAPARPSHGHSHDESNCELHAMLGAPLVAAHATPPLVQLGLFVAFLTLLATPVARLRLPARIDCRGPPSCIA